MNYNELDTSILEAFKELDTSSLTDALDKQGIAGGLLGIKPLFREPVFAVRLLRCNIFPAVRPRAMSVIFSTMSRKAMS